MSVAARRGVVITGLGVVCSIAEDVPAFARGLRDGRTGIALATGAGEHEPPLAAEIRRFDFASAVSYVPGVPADIAEHVTRVASRAPFGLRLATVAALEAWAGAGLYQQSADPERVSLVVCGNNLVGRSTHEVTSRYAQKPQYLPPRLALQFQDTDHVGTVSQALHIRGEGFSVGGASASGNLGIMQASRLIELGAADICLVLGALADLSPLEKQSFFNLGAMAGRAFARAPRAACRPFDRAHEGFVYGQGVGCLVLESLESARRRAAPALAALLGYASHLDGNAQADPNEHGEARAMTRAIAHAGLSPNQISYLNTHGSSSPLGDRTELNAIRRAFGDAFSQPILNSTKGWIGHCLSSASVIEAIALVLQMRGDFVHPNANLESPIDPGFRFAGATSQPASIEYAMSNAFGFGGFNSCIVFGKKPHETES
jgi:malonyl-ACP decarboxylase